MDINPVMPTTIDALHLILGGLGFILLVVAVLRGGGKKAPAPDSATEPEPVAPAATPTPASRSPNRS